MIQGAYHYDLVGAPVQEAIVAPPHGLHLPIPRGSHEIRLVVTIRRDTLEIVLADAEPDQGFAVEPPPIGPSGAP